MANRFCEGCGGKMSPRWPRKRMPNGQMWCPACALNHGRNLATAKVDWDEYRRTQDAQQRRYERSGVGGGEAEHDEYFGRGEYAGHGTEHLVTPKEWMRQSRETRFDDLPPHEREWHRGHELGEKHGADPDHADFAEMDSAARESSHPDHFSDGYINGLHLALPRTASATWGPEDAIRFDLGRQKVRMVTERPGGTPRALCDYHTSVAAQRAGLTDSIARGTGIRDEGERSPFTVHPSATEGRCADCATEQKKTMPWAGRNRPRHAPPEEQEKSPMPPSEFHRGGWPYRPRNSYERSVPVPATPYSLNCRVAVRTSQGTLPGDAPNAQKLAHFIAWDQPDIVKCAHDSGDSMTIFHCPFCGSGQVIARSDGTTECEFCHSAFTVQVQPQFSAFPQTIDGVPVDVPGMPSNTQMPMGADPNAMPPEDGEVPPEGDEPPADDEGDGGEDDKPAFLKGSYLTATGATLPLDDYLRHLAISCAPDREAALNRVRATR